ncbi:hypothetical protein [Demequina soli]|uniref:hypothetical protein n=1 Tax=Demequina soli TaxID=1638987 RepID=UPI000782D8C0|nr:hypothetical protein [Demequina soli]
MRVGLAVAVGAVLALGGCADAATEAAPPVEAPIAAATTAPITAGTPELRGDPTAALPTVELAADRVAGHPGA